jgi:hypothetical protein
MRTMPLHRTRLALVTALVALAGPAAQERENARPVSAREDEQIQGRRRPDAGAITLEELRQRVEVTEY